MYRRAPMCFLLLLVACGGEEGSAPGRLGVGLNAVPDPTGRADYLIDLGVALLGGERRAPWLLTNDGGEAVEATIGLVPLPFALEGEPVREVPAGSRTELFFAFRPTAEGEAEATVEIASPVGSHRVRLIGRGVRSVLGCTPPSIDFGNVPVGETRRLTITCANGGQLAETIVVGPLQAPADFRWDINETGVTRTLAPGESLPIGIEFTPRARGEFGATFEVDRAAGGKVASVLIFGASLP